MAFDGQQQPPLFARNVFRGLRVITYPTVLMKGFKQNQFARFRRKPAPQGKLGKLILLPSQVRVGCDSVKTRKTWAKKKQEYLEGWCGGGVVLGNALSCDR